jgi:hypothetical protein
MTACGTSRANCATPRACRSRSPGDGVWQPGEAIHGLKIRVTIDTAFTVRDIAVAMDDVPHPECPQAQAPMRIA